MTPAPQISLQHHLTDDLVFRYAAGQLDEAASLLVASHLALCPDCRALLLAAEALGGNLLDEQPATVISDESWQQTLARLDTRPADAATLRADISARRAQAAVITNPLIPSPLRPYLKTELDQLPWRPLGTRIRDLELLRSPTGSTARLLYVKAGGFIFEHSHRGTELTLTLQGSYQSNGQQFRRGDVEFADAETQHRPVADLEGDCLCLVVTDAPLAFRTLLGRLLQPLIRI